jgi:N-acetylneuraminate 9-O-acetyltransferase
VLSLKPLQVLVRLNSSTILLAYTMNTDYLFYYFAPLVSMWFVTIYTTLAITSHLNGNATFLVSKILISSTIMSIVMKQQRLLEAFFDFLSMTCSIRWSAREWAFRVNLDIWIVYAGMLTAVASLKIREHKLPDHPKWPIVTRVAIASAALTLICYFAFELNQESKFTYNQLHPYISVFPVLAFVVLRNATSTLRATSSRVFRFVGKFSLETFILQYHIWLAGDTKGVLLIVPGTKWRPFNFIFTTFMFVYLSDQVAKATTDFTTWYCATAGFKQPALSLDRAMNAPHMRLHHSLAPLNVHGGEVVEIDDTERAQDDLRDGGTMAPRLLDRLAPSPPMTLFAIRKLWGWSPGLKSRAAIALSLLWILNVIW